MMIEEFSDYKFAGNNQYPLDDRNYIVAVKEDSNFSNKNIIPLYYIGENNEILGIDEELIGNSLIVISTQRDTATEEIATRFYLNELFKIVRGPFHYNERHEVDYRQPKTMIYKNYLQPLYPNDIIEIFEGEIDVKKSRLFIEQTQLRELINNRYISTNQALFISSGSKIVGPFTVTRTDDEGYYLAEKNLLYKFGVYYFKQEDYLEVKANLLTRKIINDKSVIQSSYLEGFDLISDSDLISWFGTEILNSKNNSNSNQFTLVIEQIEKANSAFGNIENKERYDRIFKILSETKELLFSRQTLINAHPISKSSKKNLTFWKNENSKLQMI